MGRVAILADDLTGALDTAAPFAAKDDAVTVAWRKAAIAGRGAFAFDTETRRGSAEDATAAVLSCLPRLKDAGIGFKKLDSLMRGNTIEELAACAGSRDFASVVIAPAFPEQGRITRGGRQIAPARGEAATDRRRSRRGARPASHPGPGVRPRRSAGRVGRGGLRCRDRG